MGQVGADLVKTTFCSCENRTGAPGAAVHVYVHPSFFYTAHFFVHNCSWTLYTAWQFSEVQHWLLLILLSVPGSRVSRQLSPPRWGIRGTLRARSGRPSAGHHRLLRGRFASSPAPISNFRGLLTYLAIVSYRIPPRPLLTPRAHDRSQSHCFSTILFSEPSYVAVFQPSFVSTFTFTCLTFPCTESLFIHTK